jgi:MYXO-CTERM domain-containing protein
LYQRFLPVKHSPWLGLALIVGCGGCADVAEHPASSREPVISGKISEPADDAVVLLRTDRGGGASVCSGSLLAPNLLLTARHCIVAEYPADNIHCNPDGTLDMPSGGQLGEPAPASDVNVFTGGSVPADGVFPGGEPAAVGAQILTTTWPAVCRDDIALVVLDRALEQPLATLDLRIQVAPSQQVSVLGYGATETSEADAKYSPRHRRDGVRVKYVGTLPDTFVLPRAVCKGDSGGPALDAATGAVLGVFSLGFPGDDVAACTSETALNYFVQVNHYEALLREAFEAAGQPFPEPTGEGGAGGADGGMTPSAGAAAGSTDAGGAGATPAAGGAGSGQVEPTAGSAGSRKSRDDGCQFGAATPPAFGSTPLAALALLLSYGWRRRRRSDDAT